MYFYKIFKYSNNLGNYIKYTGLFELLIGGLILLGDQSGGILAISYFIIVWVINNVPFNYRNLASWPIHGFLKREKVRIIK